MGMSLPEMEAFCDTEPADRKGQSLPGAHLPPKGFWIAKRPTTPSTAAAPKMGSRLKRKVTKSSLADQEQNTSNGL